MKNPLLDIYTDYLIAQNKHATATGLSDLLEGDISHDKITRFLNRNDFKSKDLWDYIKPKVRQIESDEGVLILDDMIEEKPFTDPNKIVNWFYSHAKGKVIKGVNILSCLARYGDHALPIDYKIIEKDIVYTDEETQKERRKSSISKNELFREIITQAKQNEVKYKWILADSWFGSKENLRFIHEKIEKKFIIGLKSNRLIAFSEKDKKDGRFQSLKSVELESDAPVTVWLKDLTFPVKLLKKVFKNENRNDGILYLVTNDLEIGNDLLYEVYQKRWRIEEYHKSVKQNASLAKSPTKVVRSQSNHIFTSIIAYCKLEILSMKTRLNHFAMKYKLVIRANQIAYRDLQELQSSA